MRDTILLNLAVINPQYADIVLRRNAEQWARAPRRDYVEFKDCIPKSNANSDICVTLDAILKKIDYRIPTM